MGICILIADLSHYSEAHLHFNQHTVWSRTVYTSTPEPLEHSNEFSLWRKRWAYWLETAWPVVVANEQSLSSNASKRTTSVTDLVKTKLIQQKCYGLFCIRHLICINNLIGFVRSMYLFYQWSFNERQAFQLLICVLPIIWLPQAFICRNLCRRC